MEPIAVAREWRTPVWAGLLAHPYWGIHGLFRKVEEKCLWKIKKEYLPWLTVMCFEEFIVHQCRSSLENFKRGT